MDKVESEDWWQDLVNGMAIVRWTLDDDGNLKPERIDPFDFYIQEDGEGKNEI